MALETQTTENMALYSQWVRMWNGELELSDQIIGDDFIVHLDADSCDPQVERRDSRAVRAWVDATRSRNDEMTYNLQDGPLVSGSTVLAYWRAKGRARTSDRSLTDFAKVGVDVLRVANGKFVECWTANFNAVAVTA
ncbi:MAG: nuclear transport factor 2 family protein [Rhizobacter sp.]|nr:nuclear transport factor 2 family protein [Rhizobacter sp.]